MIDLVSLNDSLVTLLFQGFTVTKLIQILFLHSFSNDFEKRFVSNQRLYGKNSLRGQTPARVKPHRTTGEDQEELSSSLFVNTTPFPKFSKSV